VPTKIITTAVCNEPGVDESVEFSARAGRTAIDASDIADADIRLLINIGVYRDSNIQEPALAALIQGRIGLNDDPLSKKAGDYQGGGTFSFDLMNGACGLFNAIQVAHSFIENGPARAALIVSSNVHPSRTTQPDFPYTHLGAAMVVASSPTAGGFKNISLKTSDGDYTGGRTVADLGSGAEGRAALEFQVDGDYCQRLNTFARAGVSDMILREKIDIAKIKYAIVDLTGSEGAAQLTTGLGLSKDQCIDVDARYGASFTSFPILGYHMACARGIASGDQLLFISAGAGLTLGCGLYVV
jgi:3-oxoacyl-[acyl-carrier-protein] synthase-3